MTIGKKSLRGLYPASALPFDKVLRINIKEFGAYVEQMGQVNGVAGIAVSGHAGEVATLSSDERVEVIKVAKQNVPSSMPIIAGIEGLSMENIIARAREAKEAGADAGLVLPPFDYLPFRPFIHQPGQPYKFFKALNDAVDLPLVIFNYPSMPYSTDELLRIAKLDNVVGIKASYNTTYEYYDAYCRLKDEISVLAANDTADLLGMMTLGTDGALIGVSNMGTKHWAQFVSYILENKFKEARDLFVTRLEPLTHIYGSGALVVGKNPHTGGLDAMDKEALVQLGLLSSSRVRPPQPDVSKEDKEFIRRTLRQVKLLPAAAVARA